MTRRPWGPAVVLFAVFFALSAAWQVEAAGKKGAVKTGSEDLGIEIELTSGHVLTVSPGKSIDLPAGTYPVKGFTLLARDKGRIWRLKSTRSLGQLASLTVTEGETTVLDIGPPLTLQTLAMKQKDGQTISIGLAVKGKSDEYYAPGVFAGSEQAPAPKFQIVNESGKTMAAGQLEYG